MTREERELSTTYLEKMKEDYIEGEGYERHPLPEYYAIETAIKALEQEPCEDCVSRKEVADIINRQRFGINKISMGIIKEKLEALPSVTPTQKWIPTKDRQPEENGNYLAFYRTSDGSASLEFMMVDHCNAGGGWLHEEKGRKAYKKVIAWQPLPKPYREGEE